MPRTLRALALTLLLACPLLSSGCATSGQLAFGNTPAAFGGTRLWGTALGVSAGLVVNESDLGGMGILLLIADLPLSLAADVALLPITIPMELSHGGETRLLDSGHFPL